MTSGRDWRQTPAGAGITFTHWMQSNQGLISHASTAHDYLQLYQSLTNSVNNFTDQLNGLIAIRDGGDFAGKTLADINTKIGEIARLAKQHPGY